MSAKPIIPRPLFLPNGSIRAILALTLVCLVALQILVGREPGLLLSEALMIVLAYYFASRRVIKLPDSARHDLEAQGLLEREENPLWLPRGSVRLLILGIFALLALLLYAQGRLLDSATLASIGLIFAFLAGVVVRWIRGGRNRDPRRPRFAVLVHLKALAVLAISLLLVVLSLEGDLQNGAGLVENLLLAFILYYFGSR